MNYPTQPLRFKISDWRELINCKSNNDKNLSIRIADIRNPPCLEGFRISVVHPEYGNLFTEILGAKGTMITGLSNSNANSTPAFQLDAEHILQELRKFGFYIVFEQRKNLPSNVLEYLNTVRGLKFDKLRVLNTEKKLSDGTSEYKWYVVAFRSCAHEFWLNNNYCASEKEFLDALLDGTAINISDFYPAKGFNWSWLDFVANIDDVLRSNMMEDINHGC